MIRVAITGPESSGKSTLSKALSKILGGTRFPEFARSYLDENDLSYTRDDLNTITTDHLEQFAGCTDTLQIIDTDFIVMKVWSEVKYGMLSDVILNAINANHFDLHILCTPDIPWEDHPQREHPDKRDYLFERYKKALLEHNKHYIIVSGTSEQRIEKSLEAIASIQS